MSRLSFTAGPWELSGQFYVGGRPARAVYRPGDTAETRILILGSADQDCDADATLVASAPELVTALEQLETAAERRETPMGDPSDLIVAKANLAAAAKHAREVIAKAKETTR